MGCRFVFKAIDSSYVPKRFRVGGPLPLQETNLPHKRGELVVDSDGTVAVFRTCCKIIYKYAATNESGRDGKSDRVYGVTPKEEIECK